MEYLGYLTGYLVFPGLAFCILFGAIIISIDSVLAGRPNSAGFLFRHFISLIMLRPRISNLFQFAFGFAGISACLLVAFMILSGEGNPALAAVMITAVVQMNRLSTTVYKRQGTREASFFDIASVLISAAVTIISAGAVIWLSGYSSIGAFSENWALFGREELSRTAALTVFVLSGLSLIIVLSSSFAEKQSFDGDDEMTILIRSADIEGFEYGLSVVSEPVRLAVFAFWWAFLFGYPADSAISARFFLWLTVSGAAALLMLFLGTRFRHNVRVARYSLSVSAAASLAVLFLMAFSW